MDGVGVATFRRRKAGETRRVELLPAAAGQPAVVVEFEVPDAIGYARIEAASRTGIEALIKSPVAMARYGFSDKGLTAEDAESLREIVFLIEAAVRLWRDWNVRFEGDGEGDALSPPRIAELLHDPFARAAWHIHLTGAAALDRAEGNASAASPSMSSDEAAITAATAKRSRPRAPKDSRAGRAATALGSSSGPGPAKAS